MKRFLIKISVFVLLLGFACLIILLLPIDKRYQYAFSKTDCTAKSNYIYHRLYQDTTAVDVVFIGSSHTMCGINDSIVHLRLQESGVHATIANLAICRLGRNMDYVIIKDLLRTKHPRLIVLEVKQEEPDRSHPEFGYRADLADVLMPASPIDLSYFTDVANAFVMRTAALKDRIAGEDLLTPYESPSVSIYRQQRVADTAVLVQGARRRWERYYSQPRVAWLDSLTLSYPKAYMAEIMRLEQEGHARVVFLYIPNYGYPWRKPRELAYYRQLADVYLMPEAFFDDTKHWIEDEHLNADGATILSDSAAAYIARQLR
ncbi:MAG: hypothetical protein JSS76_16730 [Bacteroidetes bacterium]|nr:hypothetical protein [Bacteroidota bacterium]